MEIAKVTSNIPAQWVAVEFDTGETVEVSVISNGETGQIVFRPKDGELAPNTIGTFHDFD